MEFDGEIASFKVLNEKVDPHNFQSCNASNVFDSLLQQDSKGPYKENQMENESFVLNVIPLKKEMVKKKKTKVGRPLVKQVANYMYWLRRQPPLKMKMEVRLRTTNQALLGRQSKRMESPHNNQICTFLLSIILCFIAFAFAFVVFCFVY